MDYGNLEGGISDAIVIPFALKKKNKLRMYSVVWLDESFVLKVKIDVPILISVRTLKSAFFLILFVFNYSLPSANPYRIHTYERFLPFTHNKDILYKYVLENAIGT